MPLSPQQNLSRLLKRALAHWHFLLNFYITGQKTFHCQIVLLTPSYLHGHSAVLPSQEKCLARLRGFWSRRVNLFLLTTVLRRTLVFWYCKWRLHQSISILLATAITIGRLKNLLLRPVLILRKLSIRTIGSSRSFMIIGESPQNNKLISLSFHDVAF